MDKKRIKSFLSSSLYILFVLCITFVIIKYVGQRTHVLGGSMEPTLYENDNLIVDKITYRFRAPKRFEIVVFPNQDNPRIFYVKRVIGLPGDTIYIPGDGNVYVNGKLLKEDYVIDGTENGGNASVPLTLGKDEYFVMGDNRQNSTDSRANTIGIIHSGEITGRAVARIWPLNDMKILKTPKDTVKKDE